MAGLIPSPSRRKCRELVVSSVGVLSMYVSSCVAAAPSDTHYSHSCVPRRVPPSRVTFPFERAIRQIDSRIDSTQRVRFVCASIGKP